MDQLYTMSHVSNISRKTKLVDMFSKIKSKSVKTENKEHIKLDLFHCKIRTLSKIITIYNNFVRHKNWVDTCDVRIQLY